MSVLILAVILATLDVSVVDELEPLYPDRAGIELRGSRLDVPRGGTASVHVMVRGASGPVSLRLEGGQLFPQRWFRLHDVPVEENTGLESRTERFKGDVNPHVIRRAPFRVYEAMEPARFPVDNIGAFRLEIDVPIGAHAQSHAMVIEVVAGKEIERLPLVVVVHEAVVPPPGRDTLGYTNCLVHPMSQPITITNYGASRTGRCCANMPT